jgi:hypothetical protein
MFPLTSNPFSLNAELADYFKREVARSFDFLVDEHHYRPLGLSIDVKTHFATVTYVRENTGIECILDAREEDVDCKVFRPVGGHKPKHYDADDQGNIVREGLASLLRRRGVRTKLFRPVGHLNFRDRIPVTLGDFAEMLKTYGQDILSDSPDALR